jgi:sarcosine oxidase, subunit beta
MSSRVAIIGAGSTGSSTAYHLSMTGVPVVLIERDEIGHGMTSRSTAIVRTHYSNEIVAKMALYSLKILRNFSAIGNSGFVQCGMLVLASDPFRKAIESNVKMLRQVGIKEEELSKSEAIKMFTDLDLSNLSEGGYIALEPESGYADPVATAGAYAEKARQMGAEIILRNGVKKIDSSNGKVDSLELDDGTKVNCDKVILCTNVWTNNLLKRSGVNEEDLLPIRSVPHPVVVYRRPPDYQGKRVIVSDYYNKAYYKPEGQSLLFGGSIDASIDSTTVDPDNAPSDVPFEYVSSYSEQISSRIPAMRNAEFHSAYIGMYDITPDEHPIIDNLSEKYGMEGMYCCVGLSGHGFKLCPAFGIINTEMVLGVKREEWTFDRSHFSLERYKTGKLMNTKYPGLGSVG